MRRLFTVVAMAATLLASPGFLVAADEVGSADIAADGEASVDELRVNINTDDAATIAAGLKGIGQKRAEAIVRYREANGPFREAGELLEVKGVGPRTLEENASRIQVE